jgi:predicted RNase H-like HicB family nuclease
MVVSQVTIFISVSLKNECSLRLADPMLSHVSPRRPQAALEAAPEGNCSAPRREVSAGLWRDGPRMFSVGSEARSTTGRRATVSAMSAMTFNAVFEDAGDGWVYAHVPELPEVHTQGENLEEARSMVRKAIELVLEDRRERGEPIPATGWALVEPVEIAA